MLPARLLFFVSCVALCACPPVLSLECASCESDDACAPQGLVCRDGVCSGPASQCSPSRDGGIDAGTTDAGTRVTPVLPPLGTAPGATVLVEDDFEGAALVGDGGHWDDLERAGQVPGQTLAVVADAGLAGSRALVVTDVSPSNPQYGLVTVKRLPEQQGDFFVRAWVRLVSTASTGAVAIAVYSPQVNSTVAAEFSVFNEAVLKGGQLSSDDECPDRGTWTDDRYHLVELTLRNMGSAGGRSLVRLDGTPMCEQSRNWTGAGIDTVALGPSYNDPSWQGRVQFDGFTMTRDAPPPGRLEVVAPTPLSAGCLPTRLELHDAFDGMNANAVRPMRVGMSVDAYTAADCSGVPTRELRITTGQSAATFFWRAEAGVTNVKAVDLAGDVLEGSHRFDVP